MRTPPEFDEIGNWSEIKLAILEEYAKAYSGIMSAQKRPPLWHAYVDAFAGPGIHMSKLTNRFVLGSPLNALLIRPPFKEFHLIDLDAKRVDALQKQVGERKDVHIYQGNCNEILLRRVFPQLLYSAYRRGLCLLDPYGLHLDWEVIQKAAEMKSIEIFLNFPVLDMNRNVLWRDPEGVSEKQVSRMDRFWGDSSWHEIVYRRDTTLFNTPEKQSNEVLVEAFRKRLRKVAGFARVPSPMPMRNSTGAIVYYLFFASQESRRTYSSRYIQEVRESGNGLMAITSNIEWTDATWNPVRGCTKISPGCKHCYAETFAERFRGVKGHPYEQGFDLRLVPEKLAEPLRWRKPNVIFVNSMSDLFHDQVPDGYIEAVARVMAAAKWHTYQVLTKRSERLRNLLSSRLSFAANQPHIWWGVSVEDKKYGLPRVQDLSKAPAAVRFLSVEPLLEELGPINLDGIDWMIVGGESGPGARPMAKEWVLSLLQQCRKQQVKFFFKQWGGVRKSATGRRLNGRTYDELPACVTKPVSPVDDCLRIALEIEAAYPRNQFVPITAIVTAA